MNRAYSLLTIRSADEDQRVIEGIATTPTPDKYGDVVEPRGAEFKLPIPLLRGHDSSEPIGHVTNAKVTAAGIEIRAKLVRLDEPGALRDRLDMAWQEIKSGLVGGLSIGFQPIESSRIEGTYSYRFLKWLWLELSAVVIPANGDATIQTIKSLDRQQLAASGRALLPIVRTISPGVSGSSKPHVPKDNEMPKTIAEQISAFEATRVDKEARMVAIMEKAGERGETLDAAETEEYDGLASELKSIDSHLGRLRDLEKAKAAAARPVTDVTDPAAGTRTRGTDPVIRSAEKPAPGIRLARLARCKALARIEGMDVLRVADELYGNRDPAIVGVIKNAVSAGNSGNTTWAGNLVGDETSVYADFVEYLRPMTILGKFGANGIPGLRRVPFRTALIGQTSAGSGYWVGEGKGIGMTKFDFSRTSLTPLKVGNIAAVTMETLRDSSPSAEMIVRDQLAAALRERLDIDFIDPDKVAVASVSPASITNGISTIGAGGTDANSVRDDVRQLMDVFLAANNTVSSGVWIMPSRIALALSLMVNTLGQPEFPGITMMGGTFVGLPVIASEYVPQVTSGSYVVLVNAQDIYLADEGGIQIDMSTEASLQMDDTPGANSTTPTHGQVVSLWQTDTVGFRAQRTINWAARRSDAIAVLSGCNWGSPAEST